MITSIGDNYRIYDLIIVKLAKKIVHVKNMDFQTPFLSHLTMLSPRRVFVVIWRIGTPFIFNKYTPIISKIGHSIHFLKKSFNSFMISSP